MSSTSCGQAPARWQPCTLRTVSPHASRVVRPTLGEVAHQVGDALELDEVELHVLAGGDVAPAAASSSRRCRPSCRAARRCTWPYGILDPHHLVVAALALAVDAVVEAEDPEHVLVDVARRGSRRARARTCAMSAACSGSRTISRLCIGVGPQGSVEYLTGSVSFQDSSVSNPTSSINIPRRREISPAVPRGGQETVRDHPRSSSATRNARSSDWRPLSRGSHIVS